MANDNRAAMPLGKVLVVLVLMGESIPQKGGCMKWLFCHAVKTLVTTSGVFGAFSTAFKYALAAIKKAIMQDCGVLTFPAI